MSLHQEDEAGSRCVSRATEPTQICRRSLPAQEALRSVYGINDPGLAATFVERLGHDLQDESCRPEVRRLGRTILRWRHQITAWHQARVNNEPTEAVNNLIKRVKRVAFGFRRLAHYRIRARSTPAAPTGPYSPPSHPAKREAPG